MKYNFTIQELPPADAVEFIQARHYSKVMPRLTKHYLGIYDGTELAGVLTLGWGTQPYNTIHKLFPTLASKDYYEIGKMCMDESYPRNSETQMLSKVRKWIQDNLPEKQFLFTWADGIVGKVGYVYQAFNFLYGGYIWTDIYIGPDGEKIHPRSTRQLLRENEKWEGVEKLFWLTHPFTEHKGIVRVKGKQFRYILPLNKNAGRLLKESTVVWNKEYPKEDCLKWKVRTGYKKYEELPGMPSFDLSVVNVNKNNVEAKR
jgi:hypothetical protein